MKHPSGPCTITRLPEIRTGPSAGILARPPDRHRCARNPIESPENTRSSPRCPPIAGAGSLRHRCHRGPDTFFRPDFVTAGSGKARGSARSSTVRSCPESEGIFHHHPAPVFRRVEFQGVHGFPHAFHQNVVPGNSLGVHHVALLHQPADAGLSND